MGGARILRSSIFFYPAKRNIDNATLHPLRSPIMNKLFRFLIVLMAFSAVAVFAQTPTPASSPEASSSPAAKQKHSKKKNASPAATAATSSSPAAASPAPGKQKHSKKTEASSTTTSSPSPAKKSWFSLTPQTSPAATPAPVANASSKQATKTAEPTGTQAAGGGPGMVWVNTETHVYHKEGSRWYGKTKKGKYVSEEEAMKEGDHADKEEAKAKKK